MEDGCLWQRYDDDEDRSQQRSWSDAECAFVVPLTAFNTSEDLQEMIIDPIYLLMTTGLIPQKMDQRILRFKIKDLEVRLTS